MLTSAGDRRLVTGVLSVAALAWLALLAWSLSPYRARLSHDGLEEASGGSVATVVVALQAGWLLMTVAMMLPASLPFLSGVRRAVSRRPDTALLLALTVGGYLAAWALFGVAAHLGDLALHRVVAASATIERNVGLIGSGVLLLAGLYQIMPLKEAFLRRLEAAPVASSGRWCVHVPARRAFRVGLRHGGVCVGCCWPLMLTLFALGDGNIVLMALVAGVMAVETLTDWGRELRVPLGIGLIAGGVALLLI